MLPGLLADARVLVVGAGSMSSLAATTISRLGSADLVIINRTLAKAEHLAAATGGRALPLLDLELAMSQADLIISCTGAVGHVITAEKVAAAAALALRWASGLYRSGVATRCGPRRR